MSGFFSGSFDPSWPHAVLLTAAIVASFAVAAGIVMENPKWSLANALVVGGVAIEAVCTLLLFGFDEGISSAQQSKIIALQTRLLEVAQRTANRHITPEESKAMSDKLMEFSGQPARIVIFPVNFETVGIGMDIWGVLLNAHWSVPAPDRLSTPPHDFLVQSIWIDGADDDASQKAKDALFDVFKLTSIGVSGIKGKNLSQFQFDSGKPLVWIFVGDKPTPLRDWVTP